MSLRSPQRGFMEPIKHITYYEDFRSKPKHEDDPFEARGFDLCEDSSEEESNDAQTERIRSKHRGISSYGSIKKPKYKPKSEADPRVVHKIAPNRNAKHSIRVASEDSEGESEAGHLDEPKKITLSQGQISQSSVETFIQEKAWQRELPSTARFDNARKRRAENRMRFHNACQKARKTRGRAIRDAATAAACLVEDIPPSGAYILVDSSEIPTDFVDLAARVAVRPTVVSLKKKPAVGQWPAKTNWKGENMDLKEGAAYVVVTSHE